MIERNQPCPCGSGKKYKKCCGASAGAVTAAPSAVPANATASAGRAAPPTKRETAVVAAAVTTAPMSQEGKPFLVHTGRGVDSEKTEAARKKHLRKRIQERDLRGTMFYNSGAFFRPPEK